VTSVRPNPTPSPARARRDGGLLAGRPENGEADVREDRADERAQHRDGGGLGHSVGAEHPRGGVRGAAADERDECPQRHDLRVLRPRGIATQGESDTDDRPGDGERGGDRVAREHPDRDEEGGGE
jgi:hypothetical protein